MFLSFFVMNRGVKMEIIKIIVLFNIGYIFGIFTMCLFAINKNEEIDS